MSGFRNLQPGDAAPGFTQKSSSNPRYIFDSAAGRHLLLCILGSGKSDHAQAAISAAMERKDLFNDERACFFGVSMDPADEAGRLKPHIPGFRYFWDEDGTIGSLYGALPADFKTPKGGPSLPQNLRNCWILIDPAMRIEKVIPFAKDRSDIAQMLSQVEQATSPQALEQYQIPAPILVLPRIFEPEFCEALLTYCAQNGTKESGYMVQEEGMTKLKVDARHKQRRDCVLEDDGLRQAVRNRIISKIIPQIAKAYNFHPTRIERYLIGHYSQEERGFFAPHRDNTTKGTAHRRFAISIGLNDEYEGGELRFPEFGDRKYKVPKGGAVIFSCSLLHTVLPVTSGQRYVFLPFLYDDAAAKIRAENEKFLDM